MSSTSDGLSKTDKKEPPTKSEAATLVTIESLERLSVESQSTAQSTVTAATTAIHIDAEGLHHHHQHHTVVANQTNGSTTTTPMASSDSGVESTNEIDGTTALFSAGDLIKEASPTASTADVVHPSTHRDTIVCGDCAQEFSLQQFAAFIEHKVDRVSASLSGSL